MDHGTVSDGQLFCVPHAEGRSYKLLNEGALPDGDFYVAPIDDDGNPQITALFDGATGNVLACAPGEDPRALDPQPAPTVRIVGDLDGQTGQVTVIQPDGSYRRYSRWDRIEHGSPAQPDAILRTLPQCGCGGSLGMPKLFESFAQMSAYFYCTFAL